MNDQEHESLIKKMVSNARAIISDQIGLSVGIRKMCNILTWLSQYETVKIEEISVFEKYDKAVQYIPSGTARLHCSKDAFNNYDAQLEEVNYRFRKKVLEVCFEIIEKYANRRIILKI